MEKNEWFERWFDTEYYPILYDHRDDKEARQWIDALLAFLEPPSNAQVLDLACGRGRHSIYLSQLGYRVKGIDLSPKSIAEAQRQENKLLQFEVADMRELNMKDEIDLALNLFTSFGYFDSDNEHIKVLQSVWDALKQGGVFVLDYMNAQAILDDLQSTEIISKGGINFMIEKTVEGEQIVKRISFTADGKKRIYEERVCAFSKEKIENLFRKAGFNQLQCFGDYKLCKLSNTSPRMIIIAKK